MDLLSIAAGIPELIDLFAETDGRFDILAKAAGLNPAQDFKSRDLRAITFAGADLRGFDFRGSDLRGTQLRHCKHVDQSTKLSHAKLDDEDFAWNARRDQKQNQASEDLIDEFLQASRNGELYHVFAPKMSLETGEILGVEAQLRWRSSEGKIRTKDQIAPILDDYPEETRHVTHWSIGDAIEAQRFFLRSGFEVTISVQLPSLQLALPDFADECVRLFGGMNAHIRFNISEVDWLDPRKHEVPLQKLYDAGVRFCISDFGAGYASLAYLRMPFINELQVDRSIIRNICDASEYHSLAKHIVELGHSHELDVTADGVETLEQLTEVANLGFEDALGFYLSRPLPRAEMMAFLSEQASNPRYFISSSRLRKLVDGG